MTHRQLLHVLLLVGSVFLACCAQLLLKKAAQRAYPDRLRAFLNPLVVTAYGIFFLSSFLTMLALREVPLSAAPAIESVGFFFTALFGKLFLGEAFHRKKVLGLLLIVAGIVLFSLPR